MAETSTILSFSSLSFPGEFTMDGSQGGSNVPPFLTKTYEMVDDPSTNSIVSWSPRNNSFIVWSLLEFTRDLLPKYFKHNNFSSFVRQLNTYGFGKIDPDQWEFANEDFIRGHTHLLKKIHRRKPIHSHSVQNHHGQGNSGLGESEKHEFEEEIGRLKNDKSFLLLELQRHTQDQQGIELQTQSLEGRLLQMEHHQQQMMFFLARIMEKPGFVSNIMQQSEHHNKKRGLPKPNYFYNENNMEENGIVAFQTATIENSDAKSMLLLNLEPFEKLESSLNSLEKFLHGVGQASGEDMYAVEVPLQHSAVVLNEMHESYAEPDINLKTQSPKLHPASPHSRDIQLFPEFVDSTSSVENPVITSVQINVDIRHKSSRIDVNSKPAAASEVEASKEVFAETTTSAVTTGMNDMFWEQFLTETPGSSNAQEVQSERRDTDDLQIQQYSSFSKIASKALYSLLLGVLLFPEIVGRQAGQWLVNSEVKLGSDITDFTSLARWNLLDRYLVALATFSFFASHNS
ncbi:hypothetical protein HHK36_001678 [Tetracentron sinense]|uniref:HSF-type DNA-binding domain-containing protein n=1 Tax=Tetracentron sinense TaxID=13715 RepID=A0A835DRV6_TETSI|nr:hypothetical protein HHK36_001678 [Tetracentron sinense]